MAALSKAQAVDTGMRTALKEVELSTEKLMNFWSDNASSLRDPVVVNLQESLLNYCKYATEGDGIQLLKTFIKALYLISTRSAVQRLRKGSKKLEEQIDQCNSLQVSQAWHSPTLQLAHSSAPTLQEALLEVNGMIHQLQDGIRDTEERTCTIGDRAKELEIKMKRVARKEPQTYDPRQLEDMKKRLTKLVRQWLGRLDMKYLLKSADDCEAEGGAKPEKKRKRKKNGRKSKRTPKIRNRAKYL